MEVSRSNSIRESIYTPGFIGGPPEIGFAPPPLSFNQFSLDYLGNEKALKCKPSALIFGRGRAKKSIALQGYNIGIHMKEARAVARARGFDKAHALTKM